MGLFSRFWVQGFVALDQRSFGEELLDVIIGKSRFAENLIAMFAENFAKFEKTVDPEVAGAKMGAAA